MTVMESADQVLLCLQFGGFDGTLQREVEVRIVENVSKPEMFARESDYYFPMDDLYIIIPEMSAPGESSNSCLYFVPVSDEIVEGNETFTFVFAASNDLDVFMEGFNQTSVTIYDDDGKLRVINIG